MSTEWVSAGSASSESANTDPAGQSSAGGEPGSAPPAIAEPSEADWPEPIGRPAKPHWWSIQAPPPAGPISARRAYLEVLGVFLAFFAAGIVAGGETLARRFPPPSGSWALFTPATIGELTMAGLAVAVTVLLSSRRGITPRKLGLGLPRRADGGVAVAPAFRMAVWAIVTLSVGGAITSALATGHLSQPIVQDNSYLMYTTAASIAAGVVEETVVLAFVVTTLRQAGRPLAEILVVAVLLRCSYHDYYGPGVVGIAVWAAVFVWLFLRTGSVIPLVIVHFLWDATIFWAQRWDWMNTVRVLGAMLLVAGAIFTWFAEVSKRRNGSRPRSGGRSGASYTAWPFADQLYR
ncbi:MAG TPA: type II CAAX endopeptidase family protein [Streptosporangiaceae bacterium]|nr:type II CAAX endopeptidase family protein [Streptosporangiaceae bacterium]